MKSETIPMSSVQFRKFVGSMAGIGLKRKPKDKSHFPLDFVVYYKNRFTLNFEYLSGNLHFYLTSPKDKKTGKAIKSDTPILSEIKKKIKIATKSNQK